jgi:branched-chain amino acid transport system permease protein
MAEVVQVVYTALVLGAGYALIAAGLGLIWASLRFLNLAHGALFIVGAFSAYTATVSLGLPAGIGIIVGFGVGALAASILYVGVFRVLMARPNGEISTLVAGLGLAVLVQALLVILYSPRDKALPRLVGGEVNLPGDVVATGEGMLVIVVSATAVLCLGLFLERSRLGLTLRAIASHRQGAAMMGIDTGRLAAFIMAIGGGLAGVSGVLLSSFYFVSASGSFDALVKGMIVTIVGGIGSLRGMLLAALLVGGVEASVSQWLGARWALPVLFVTLMLFLLTRPQGIAGKLSFEEA